MFKKLGLFLLVTLLSTPIFGAPFKDNIVISAKDAKVEVQLVPLNRGITKGIELIDTTFDFPKPKHKAVLRFSVFRPPLQGAYLPGKEEIYISIVGNYPKLATVHELFHYTEDNIIENQGRQVKQDYDVVYKVIQSTQLHKDLLVFQKLFKHDKSVKSGSTYLLNRHELTARAFVQYTALKTKDKELTQQLNTWSTNGGFGTGQWSDDDFKKVYVAFDEFFKKHKWLK